MKKTLLSIATLRSLHPQKLIALLLLFFSAGPLLAQTKIGDDPGTPRDASAMLEVSSTAAPFRGFLMPRITTTQRDAITLPATGLMIFNTTANQVEVNTGTPAAPIWTVPAPTPPAWLLTGNAGTNPATQFLGTTDLQPLLFRTNNLERMRLSNNGFLGIGATPPSEKLHVEGGSAMVSNDAATANPAVLAVAMNTDGGTMDDITIRTYGTATSSGMEQYSARGTAAAPQAVVNGQNIGNLSFYGYTSAGVQGARSFITNLYAGDGTNNKTTMLIGTSDVERIRITDSGTVGIGTAAPSQTLDVAGTVRITGSAGTATAVMGRNAAGDIGNLTLGSGLSITGGTLNTTAASGWGLNGNAGTNPATQFLGTTDLQPLVFRTNNLERMRISNNGFLGIGVASPSEKLHVESGSAMVSNDAPTTNPAVLAVAENSNGGTMDDITIRTYGTAASAGFEQYTARGTVAAPQPVVTGQNMGNLTFYGNTSAGVQGARSFITSLYAGNGTDNKTTMLIGTSDIERIRITDAGLVGIGTAAPSQTLDVAGTARITGSTGTATAVMGRNAAGDVGNLILGSGLSIAGGTLNTTAASGWSLTGNAGTNPATQFLGTTDLQPLVFRTNNLERMRLSNNGFLGIGAAPPSEKLHVAGGSAMVSNNAPTTNPAILAVAENSNGGTMDDITIRAYGTAALAGFEQYTARGTAAAPQPVVTGQNMGNLTFYGYTSAGVQGARSFITSLYAGDGTDNKTNMLIGTSDIERIRITDVGFVGIGTAAPTAKLSVNGDANNTTGVWGVFSDNRIKTVDGNFTDGLKTVMKIRPVKFHYNNDAPFTSDDQQIGIVAQEMEAIAPYMISQVKAGGYNDLRKYNAQALPYMLVNAIQELKKELDGITQTNAGLQQELSDLKAENAQLKADKNTMTELLARLAKLESTLGVASK